MKGLFFCFLIFVLCAISYPLDFMKEIDEGITLFFEQLRNPFLTKVFVIVSDLGSIKYMLPICTSIAVILLLRRKLIEVLFVYILLYSVRQINYLLKEIYIRERPPFNAVYEALHYSFPSGHSMNSMAVYCFLCYLLLNQYIKSRKLGKKLIIFTATLILTIGISRIYLGVHYFTDVIAGFSAGFMWFFIIKLSYSWIKSIFDKNRHY